MGSRHLFALPILTLAATVLASEREAFEKPVPALTEDEVRRFAFGNRLFETRWTIAPGSVATLDGLGPLYNRRSCAGCHVRDGRGRPPSPGDPFEKTMLLRVSVPGTDERGGPKPHPRWGLQIQDQAVPGVAPEAEVTVRWRERTGSYPDGDEYRLREPEWSPAEEGMLVSARVAPALVGLGLLEGVPLAALLELADEHDVDGDGVSGRPNVVWSRAADTRAIGRFGWKANQPDLREQVAAALAGDIGITTSLVPRENSIAVPGGPYVMSGGSPEMEDEFLEKLVFYTRTLAVPVRRDVDDQRVARGESLFETIGCAACHVPSLRTGPHEVAALSEQTIRPYTDLLLHDMGEGLADGRPDWKATGREWRTPPLWGIGLVHVVNGHSFFLHDGRARSFAEAILWHGGEAARAREAFAGLPREDREAVVAFLESL
jgi:CxxC motif-containing protein (DUF1111 family)